ncbi:MAG: hypothetical protein GX811_04620, partial [Lentisphaerae bacterium]|nr:hypothetical protein [Lentisphaerota bacterium]
GRLRVGVGSGAYLFCDSEREYIEAPCYNNHGIGLVSSVSVSLRVNDRLRLIVRGNMILTDDMDTASLLGALAINTGSNAVQPAVSMASKNIPKNEFTLYAGSTIMNTYGSESTSAYAVEFRRSLFRHLDLTVSGLFEGNNGTIQRSGPTCQLWVVDEFSFFPLSFGFGAGVYLATDDMEGSRYEPNILVSISARLKLNQVLAARVMLHRVITDYDRDTDVMMAGISFLF